MPKEEWGVKRVCPTTGKRFYDLNKDPIISPYTGELVTLDTGKSRSVAAIKDTSPDKSEEDVELVDDVLDDDDDDNVDLGDDVLDDDDDEEVSLEDIADVPADDDD